MALCTCLETGTVYYRGLTLVDQSEPGAQPYGKAPACLYPGEEAEEVEDGGEVGRPGRGSDIVGGAPKMASLFAAHARARWGGASLTPA